MLLLTIQSCNTNEKDIEHLSVSFVEYLNEYTKAKSGKFQFQVLEYKYSDIINGECEVSVRTKMAEGNKVEFGTIYLTLKKYNDKWAVYQFAVAGSNDKNIEYNNAGLIDEETLNQLSINSDENH